jgi:PKD repeat protein
VSLTFYPDASLGNLYWIAVSNLESGKNGDTGCSVSTVYTGGTGSAPKMVSGVVKDQTTGLPLAGATVACLDLRNFITTTNASGEYTFERGINAHALNPSNMLNLGAKKGTEYCWKEEMLNLAASTEHEFELELCPTVANTPPNADFIANPGTENLGVDFQDQSTPGTCNLNSWSWDFGDGVFSSQLNPSKVYTEAGTYPVSLTVRDACNLGHSRMKNIQVPMTIIYGPAADFSATPTSGTSSILNVQFTDLSVAGTNPIISWNWDFGDGGVSTDSNPSHQYLGIGKYTVKLTVSDGSLMDTEIKSNYIILRDGNNLPVAGTSALVLLSAGFALAGAIRMKKQGRR